MPFLNFAVGILALCLTEALLPQDGSHELSTQGPSRLSGVPGLAVVSLRICRLRVLPTLHGTSSPRTHARTVCAQAQSSWQNPELWFLDVNSSVVSRGPTLDRCLVEMTRLMWVKSHTRAEVGTMVKWELSSHPTTVLFFLGFSPEQFRRPTRLPVYSWEPPAHQHRPQPRKPREQLHPGARVGPLGRRRRESIKVSLISPHTSQRPDLTTGGRGGAELILLTSRPYSVSSLTECDLRVPISGHLV